MIKSEKKALPLPIRNSYENEILRLKKFSNGMYQYMIQNKSKYKTLLTEKIFKCKDDKIVHEIFEEASLDFFNTTSTIHLLKKETFSLKNVEKILDSFSIYFEERIPELSLKIAKDILNGVIPTDIKYLKELAQETFQRYFNDKKGCKFCVIDTTKPCGQICSACKSNHVDSINSGYVITGKGWVDYQCFHCWEKWTENFD